MVWCIQGVEGSVGTQLEWLLARVMELQAGRATDRSALAVAAAAAQKDPQVRY